MFTNEIGGELDGTPMRNSMHIGVTDPWISRHGPTTCQDLRVRKPCCKAISQMQHSLDP